MKVVINGKHGGFSLSPKAISILAEREGKTAYFFKGFRDYTPISMEEASKTLFFSAFSVPDPENHKIDSEKWCVATKEEKQSMNDAYDQISLNSRAFNDDRANPVLIELVETLGKEVNGSCASLGIVEIPDGIEFQIEEYDGLEWVAEKHRTWS